MEAVNTSPELRTASQLLAAQAVLSSKTKRGKRANNKLKTLGRKLTPKTGRSFAPRKMYAYRARGRELTEKSRFFSVALDATRVGGTDWCNYVGTDLETHVSLWWPPQARGFRPNSHQHAMFA